MSSEYIMLALGFVREKLEINDSCSGREDVPSKVKELMIVLRVEVSDRL